MAGTTIAGNKVRLYVGTIMVGCATSASLSLTKEMLDAACKASGDWSESTPGMKSWTASLEGVYKQYDTTEETTNTSVLDFFTLFNDDTKLTIKFGTDVTGDTRFSGECYITDLEITGADGENATYSVEMTGTGPVTTVAVA